MKNNDALDALNRLYGYADDVFNDVAKDDCDIIRDYITRPQPCGDAVKALDAYRDKWVQEHGYVENDTNAYVLKRNERIYLDALNDCIETLRAALTPLAQPSGDAVMALDDLDAVFLTISKPEPIKYVVPPALTHDAINKLCKHWPTIRAALTQPPKADVDILTAIRGVLTWTHKLNTDDVNAMMEVIEKDIAKFTQPKADITQNPEWIEDCKKWLGGTVLKGRFAHWCNEWDDLPVDETCPEFMACLCFDQEETKPYKELLEMAFPSTEGEVIISGKISDLPKADVEVIKSDVWHELQKQAPNCNVAWAVNFIIDHLAAQGYINGGDGWQDISTIPDNLMSGVDLWDDREEKRYINCTFDLRVQAWADENYDFVKIPTHWMPLPAAPNKEV